MSPVILQHPLQVLAREKDAALDRAKWKGKPFGYFAVLETRNVHKEWNAIVARQGIYHAVYLLAVVIVLGNVVVELLRAVNVKKIVGVIDKCLVAHHLAVVVYEYISHYGIYPPFEICIGGVFIHIVKCFQ